MNTDEILNIIIPSVCGFILILYHSYILALSLLYPQLVNVSRQIQTRKSWVWYSILEKNQEMMTIQQSRNAILSSTLFVSLITTLSFFLLNYIIKETQKLKDYQQYSLFTIFSLAMISFAMSLAKSEVLPYEICVTDMSKEIQEIKKILKKPISEKKDESQAPFDSVRVINMQKAERTIILMSIYFTIGNRFLFISPILALWIIFGVWGILGGTILVLILLIYYDHF